MQIRRPACFSGGPAESKQTDDRDFRGGYGKRLVGVLTHQVLKPDVPRPKSDRLSEGPEVPDAGTRGAAKLEDADTHDGNDSGRDGLSLEASVEERHHASYPEDMKGANECRLVCARRCKANCLPKVAKRYPASDLNTAQEGCAASTCEEWR
jgi:hypothetical protein